MTSAPEPSRWRRAGILTLLGNGSLQLLSFASGLLAGRLLGPAGRGDLALIQTIPALMAVVGTVGLGEAAVYFCARERALAPRVVGTGLATVTLTSIAAAGVAAVLVAIAVPSGHGAVRAAAFASLVLCPIVGVYTVSYQPFRALDRLAAWNAFRVASAAAWLAILAAAWWGDSSGPVTIALAYVGAQALIAAAALALVRRTVGRFDVRQRMMSRLLRYGAPNAAASVPQIINLRFDQVLIGVMLPSRELGLYVIAVGWSSIVAPLLHSIANILFPMVASQLDDARARIVGLGARWATLIASAEAALFICLTPVMLPLLLGDRYRNAVVPACILVGAGAVSGLNVVLEEALRGLGHPKPILVAELASVAVSIGGLTLFLQKTGIVGAAWISLGAYLLLALVLLIAIHRLTALGWSDLLLWRPRDLAAVRVPG